MAGLSDLIEAIPQLAPVANALGFKKTISIPSELPDTNMSNYSPPGMHYTSVSDKLPLSGIPTSTLPDDLPQGIKAYRADPKNKYKGNNGLETQPISRFTVGGDWAHPQNLDTKTSDVYSDPSKAVQQLYKYARLNGAAAKYGYPSLSPEEIAAFALKEGRSDLGHSGVVVGNKDDLAFQKLIQETYNLPIHDANFLVALNSKNRVANKLNIPLAEAWNGTGVNNSGQTGKQYAKSFEHHKQVASHPMNKELMDLINQGHQHGLEHGLPLKENAVKDVTPQQKEVPYKRGGMIDKPLQGGSKII
jgi:hypothetical protein